MMEPNGSIQINLPNSESSFEKRLRSNELNPIATVYNWLLNLGTNAVEHHNQQKYVVLTNFMAVNTVLGSVLFYGFAFFWEEWVWLGTLAILTVVGITTLVFNALGKIQASKLAFILLSNFSFFSQGLLVGPVSDIDNCLIIMIIAAFMIYDLKDKFSITLGVLLPLGFAFSYKMVHPIFLDYNLAIGRQEVLCQLVLFTQFIVTVGSVYKLVNYSKTSEAQLESYNAQMVLQTAELKRSNGDLEQFAYIISHDLKTPVRNISSFMNLLSNKYSKDLNPEAQEFIAYSHHGAKRLERLIDDVLSYCRIGINLPRPVPVNLNEVINTIKFETREKLASNGAQININRELPVVNNVHASLVYHIFQNLITNGLKFNKSEHPQVNISWTNSLNYYTFSIQDNGIGISQEYAATIFQMFKRLHNEYEYDGTGIGLAICKKIVEYYHGEIWFDSDKDKGTTFYFTIRKF